MVDVHNKTLPKTLQVRFYVFEDTTCPKILPSCTASVRLGITEFKVPNEAPTPSALDTISTAKNIIFSKPLHKEKVPPHNPSNTTPRSAIESNTFQDHCLQDHHATTNVAPLQNHSTGVAPFQDHFSLNDVKDIFTLKKHSSPPSMQLATCQESIPFA